MMKCTNANCGYELTTEEIEKTWNMIGNEEVAVCPLCGKTAKEVA